MLQRATIARHGSISPEKAPVNMPANQQFPGAVNVAFADNHVELSRLDNLWLYYWNAKSIPKKRPGLP